VRWRFFVSEALNSIRGNVATTVAASVTVLIVTFLLAVFASVGLFLYDKTQGVRNDITVKAYMKVGTESEPATLDKVHNQLVAIPYVKSVTYVSPAEALKQLNKDLQKDAGSLTENPLPPAFYMKLTNPDKASQVSAAAGQIPEVQNCGSAPCVTYGKEIADKVLSVTKWVLVVLGALMALLGIAAVVLIANTIRLSIFSRRREIEVMNRMLFAVDGQTNRTYAYPCTETTVNGQDYVDTLRRYGLIKYARVGGDTGAVITNPATLDPLRVPALGLEDHTPADAVIGFVKSVEDSGGMGVIMFHGIGGDYITTDTDVHQRLVDYLVEHRSSIWVGTFREVMDFVMKKKGAGAR